MGNVNWVLIAFLHFFLVLGSAAGSPQEHCEKSVPAWACNLHFSAVFEIISADKNLILTIIGGGYGIAKALLNLLLFNYPILFSDNIFFGTIGFAILVLGYILYGVAIFMAISGFIRR